jgi:hypothetical protein
MVGSHKPLTAAGLAEAFKDVLAKREEVLLRYFMRYDYLLVCSIILMRSFTK